MVTRKSKKSRRKSHRRQGLRNRGAGNRGGRGRAGAGKRRAHKPLPSRRKKGFKPVSRKDYDVVNLDDLNSYKGEVELPDTKVLGMGELKKKLTVKASSFSKSARQEIERLGGKCVEL